MIEVSINKQARLSPHFTLAELCKTSVKTADGNIPSHVHIENLKRLCGWLEKLRSEWNKRYGFSRNEEGGFATPHSDLGQRTRKENSWADEPIIINSGYRSPQVNAAVGGVKDSNHLTGCAVDIHVQGMEQLLRYAVILLDIADESKETFDELLIEKNTRGAIWLHFAVRPKDNRMKIRLIQT